MIPRILVIDDEPEMIELVRLILGRREFDVDPAVGGLAAEAKLRANAYDLVLTDWMMPDVDGSELVSNLRQGRYGPANQNVPVILTTMRPRDVSYYHETHPGLWIWEVVLKPFGPQELLAAVRKALGEAPWTSQV